MATKTLSAGGVVLLVLLTLIGAWFFLPGLFDPDSKTLLASKNRRSPIAEAAGPRTLLNQEVTVREDHFQSFRFELEMPATVTVTVTGSSGPEFDLFVMDEDGFAQWDRATDRLFGGEFSYYVSGSGKTVRRSAGLRPGKYVLLIDNTDYGSTSPPMNMNDDQVKARVELTVE